MAKRGIDDRKISDMRNLGPACERDLNAAGIHTAAELKQLGAEGAFIKVLDRSTRTGAECKVL